MGPIGFHQTQTGGVQANGRSSYQSTVQWAKLNVVLMQVNLPYILWISAVNTSCILGYSLLDIFFPGRVSHLKDTSDPTGKRLMDEEGSHAPLLVEAINKNSLVIFLVVSVCKSENLISLKIDTSSLGKHRHWTHQPLIKNIVRH